MTRLSRTDALKAAGLGVVIALILAAVSMAARQAGLTPLPAPVALAFAETLVGAQSLPPAVGTLFHTVWVTVMTAGFVAASREALTLPRALSFGLALWLVALLVFFPIIGWGVAGLAVGPQLIVGALVPHLIYAALLWAGARLLFGRGIRHQPA
jgi:hypothetical protein